MKKTFAFIEFLILITVLAVLAAMLLPVVNRELEKRRRIQCGNTFTCVGLALRMYTADCPPRAVDPTYMSTVSCTYEYHRDQPSAELRTADGPSGKDGPEP